MTEVVDLFAGPGGWDLAAHALGVEPLGIEWDAAACETRRAVGLDTLEADVSEVDPTRYAGARGLIASPPCQDFSAAGTGAGRAFVGELASIAYGRLTGSWTEDALIAEDILPAATPRALLVLEPIRWMQALEPEWIALEQVPAVLPIWEAMAEGLRHLGYGAWAGLLHSERFGVPQTRTRAFLIARRAGAVVPPPATHQRYITPRKDRADMDHLFGEETPERGRIIHPADRHLLPWVSMAEALGWHEGPRPAPAPTVSAGGTAGGGGVEVFAGREARERVAAAVDWHLRATQINGHTGELGLRSIDEPAFTVATNADRWHFVASNQENATRRPITEPAPTIMFGHRANEVVWEPPTHYDVRQTGGDGSPVRNRSTDEPAPITAQGLAKGRDQWTFERPATTVCDDRISAPGHKGDGIDAPRQKEGAIRVTAAEAAVLQSFPANYPWQGTKSKTFEQIGNANPPGMALPVLRSAIS